MRQVVLDTETTGLDPAQGHRVIEIGCVELVHRRPTERHFHRYIKPDRPVEAGALEVHGIDDAFLADKPPFEAVVDELVEFIRGAELVIHNAPFDVGFLDYELGLLEGAWGQVTDYATVTDTLALARRLHPGQRNSLDALCRRYGVDNAQRELHGALLDARILADVYLVMTGGQAALSLDAGGADGSGIGEGRRPLAPERPALPVVEPSDAEARAHRAWLERLERESEAGCLWRHLERDG